jgi:hypothetical protein
LDVCEKSLKIHRTVTHTQASRAIRWVREVREKVVKLEQKYKRKCLKMCALQFYLFAANSSLSSCVAVGTKPVSEMSLSACGTKVSSSGLIVMKLSRPNKKR